MYRAILPSSCPEALTRFALSTDIRSAMLLYSDPPDHTRVRTLIQPFFTPRALAGLQPRIDALVDQLLAPIIARGGGDLIGELAFPLPAMVIAEVIGLPPEDYPIYKTWSDATVALIGTGTVTPAHLDRINDSVSDLNAYLSRLAALRRSKSRHDLLTVLLAAESRGAITWNEIVATCWSMLIGGHETTTGLIGNGLFALLRDPRALAELRSNPDLLPTAIEEFLRIDSPIQQTARVALEPLILNGIPIAKGQIVECWIGAANRDPARFPRPDRLDLCRTPNPHLAFSHGLHFCPGHALVRREATTVLARLLRRPRFALAPGASLTWNRSCAFRSPSRPANKDPVRSRGIRLSTTNWVIGIAVRPYFASRVPLLCWLRVPNVSQRTRGGLETMAYAAAGVATRVEYAGFWIRVVAAIIDGILLGIVGWILREALGNNLAGLFNFVIGLAYYAGMESSARQATIGKGILGLRVTDLDGNRITFLRAAIRDIAKIISAFILLIGFIMVAFTEKKQGLHDMIAGTLVVKAN